MKVAIAVTLDDGTSIENTVSVSSGGNPRFWSQGLKAGAAAATEQVQRMVEAKYGAVDTQGIHSVSSASL